MMNNLHLCHFRAVFALFFRVFAPIFAVSIPVFLSAQPTDYYRSPLDIPIYFSANFGEIRTNRFHTGIDIKTQGVTGKPLYAAADGYIARVTVAPRGYGRALYIAHPNGTTTVYCHMDRFRNDIEEWLRIERYRQKRSDIDAFPPASLFPVKKGETIGTAGNSGASSGPHLHYEVRESATSQTLNVITKGWVTPAEEDNTPPRIVRLYHIDIDTIAGVPIHSKARLHNVKQNSDGSYSLVNKSPLKAGPASYFVIEATDRRSDVTNTFGIYRVRMVVDGNETVVFEKDAVLFEDVRLACASVLYDIQRKTRNEAVMLATKSGNRLPMYKKAVDRGVVRFSGTSGTVTYNTLKNIDITVEDDSGNAAKLSFTIEPDIVHTVPERPAGRIATDKGNFIHYANGLAISIPQGALYEPMFYTQTVVEIPIAPRADSIRPLSPVYRIGDGVLPLQKAMTLSIAADIPDHLSSRASIAKVSDNGVLTYVGGSCIDRTVSSTTRDMGTFCVVADVTAPIVKVSFADGDNLVARTSITLTATDNFSGIAHFTGTIDGQWIIFERTASGSSFVHRFDTEKLQSGKTHTLEFTVRDGVGNTTTFKRSFYK
jgi:murein DD-endopeptidase MepM/ murein hydrolase activator NlpD